MFVKKTMDEFLNERVKLGKRLRALRQSRYKHLTQTKINMLTGLDLLQIYKIESGKMNYTIDSLLKYLKAFKKK